MLVRFFRLCGFLIGIALLLGFSPFHGDSQASVAEPTQVVSVAEVAYSTPAASPTATPAPAKYTVVAGDSLSKIAAAHHIVGGWQALQKWNGITNPNLIRVGQQLTLSGTDPSPPAAKQAPVPNAPVPPAPKGGPSDSVWDKLASCESGNRWDINTGNGFHGGLQFSPTTWTEFGGGEFASVAYKATRAQQIIVARRVLAVQGWGAWPSCSSKMGLRGYATT